MSDPGADNQQPGIQHAPPTLSREGIMSSKLRCPRQRTTGLTARTPARGYADNPNTSRASDTSPVTAAAATMSGDMRIVRPVGLP